MITADMKRLCLILCLLSLSLTSWGGPVIRWLSEVHDFGLISEDDGKVSCTFRLVNVGDTALIITSVRTSCGCTASEFDRAPIAVGDTSSVTVTYNPARRPGSFSKEIHVFTNAKPIDLAVNAKEIKGGVGIGISIISIIAARRDAHIHRTLSIKQDLVAFVERSIGGSSHHDGCLREVIETLHVIRLGKDSLNIAKQAYLFRSELRRVDAKRLKGGIIQSIDAIGGHPNLVPFMVGQHRTLRWPLCLGRSHHGYCRHDKGQSQVFMLHHFEIISLEVMVATSPWSLVAVMV